MSEKEIVLVPVVAGVVIKKENKFLLVQEKQPKAYGLWNLPAGRVETGDTIEQTAIKEAREETGFKVKIVKKLGIFQESAVVPPKHAFAAEIVGGELQIPEEELLDARWLTLEEIKSLGDKLRGKWVLEAISSIEDSSPR